MEKENKQKWVEEFDNLWGELEDSECRGFDSQPFKAFIQKTLDTQLEEARREFLRKLFLYYTDIELWQEPINGRVIALEKGMDKQIEKFDEIVGLFDQAKDSIKKKK